MIRLACSEFSTFRWNFQQDVVRYALHGYQGIGVWRKKVDEFGRNDAADLLHEMKMDVSSVHWAGGFTGCDGQSYKDAIQDAIDSIRFACQINARCLIVHPGSTNGHINRHAQRLISGALEKLVPIARDYDVRLAIEPMMAGDARNWTFVNQLDEALKLVEDYDPVDVGLVLDLFHIGKSRLSQNELRTIKDRIALVQLSDRRKSQFESSSRCCLGAGSLPLATWISDLEQAGYEGFYELELHGAEFDGVPYESRLVDSQKFVSELVESIAVTNKSNFKIAQS